VRTLQRFPPPVRILAPGQVYRRDFFDATHAPAFMQLEGLAIDEGVSFVDLKATLAEFARRFYGASRRVRFGPSYFPFVGPGAQMDVDAALSQAVEQGLDLVEVAAAARPPVVRIMDYGKFKFEQAKQARLAKKKQHVIHLKEVKYRPGIDDHDFETKTRHARRFLEEGNKVKVTLMFRGRQIAHPELGRAVVNRVAAELGDLAKVESAPTMEGKSMTMILAPK
jgi:translation initiation factor IF-3